MVKIVIMTEERFNQLDKPTRNYIRNVYYYWTLKTGERPIPKFEEWIKTSDDYIKEQTNGKPFIIIPGCNG